MRQEWIYSLSWVAGVITWFAVGIPMGAGLLDSSISLSSPAIAVWFACYVGFGLLFGTFASDLQERFSNRIHQAALWLEIVFASVALLVYPHYSTAAILFILTAVHAINLWTLGQSLLLIGGQTLLMLVAFIPTDANWVKTSMTVLAYMAFQFFALISTEIAQREARAKKELAKLNAELSAAQALLSESSKVSERVRIAGELHDILGHQLTALSLNLEIASHTEGEKARVHLQKAQQIAKDLLSDVRGVVSTVRDSHVNLDSALRALVEGVPKPAIHLVLEPGLAIDDPQKAHTLVRCVQEVITNTVRHSGAQNLWIRVEQSEGGIAIHARDDGRGSKSIQSGNGLQGMRERLEQFGGRLSVYSEPGKGFGVDAVLPT